MVAAPDVINKHDRKSLRVTFRQNPSEATTLGNGLVAYRPKFTGANKRRFTVSYVEISNAQMNRIMNLYQNAHGSAETITGFIDPTSDDDAEVLVRFATECVPTCTYNGAGSVKTWHISDIIFEEV